MARLILTGGTVIDGSGAERRRADVEVVDGRITAVGAVGPAGPDDEEVDLTGLILCPGFIDIHTHFDAQVFWDGRFTPSSWHGVTTVVQGNCGFGVAPTRPADRDNVMETLELVEGGDLDRLVSRQGPCSVVQACHFVRQAAAGLQAAHDRHLIHRDVKPSNLLLTAPGANAPGSPGGHGAITGQVKLVDFGLARQFVSRLTDPRALL